MKNQLLITMLLITLAGSLLAFNVGVATACDIGQFCPVKTPDGMKTCSMGSDGIFRCMG